MINYTKVCNVLFVVLSFATLTILASPRTVKYGIEKEECGEYWLGHEGIEDRCFSLESFGDNFDLQGAKGKCLKAGTRKYFPDGKIWQPKNMAEVMQIAEFLEKANSNRFWLNYERVMDDNPNINEQFRSRFDNHVMNPEL
ncbi:uncharacterized protein LOC142337290 [Convolutriloba macropyga]|uniref:uncharacterized protein LOC142337290 n=1 Tax=Convolutriloba macropyga TaxID=536237 RepID=UPI003F527378